jgi:acyl-CoA dehydrogenase
MNRWSLWPWPFFEERHRQLAERIGGWQCPIGHEVEEADLGEACRAIAKSLGQGGFFDPVVPLDGEAVDVRSVCVAREAISYQSVLADNVIAMQGIGTGALWMHGTPEQKAAYLDPVRKGERIAAFALTEPSTGSDVAGITTTARRDGGDYVIDGGKTFISNAPFADHYIVVARTGEAPGARGLSAFIVDAGTKGMVAGEPIRLMAPHPLAPLTFENCRIPAANLIGQPGKGFGIAMATFDIFRTSVGAACIGMARRAMDETLDRMRGRTLFGSTMAEIPGVQAKLADMSIDLDTAALAVYRAAWTKDTIGGRCSREVSIAKYAGTEAAGRIIDAAVQLFGGLGVTRGSIVEQLYREVRPARLYEGASEVQKLVIARNLIAGA